MIKYFIKPQQVGQGAYVTQVARNGETLNTSEMFPDRSIALKNVLAVIVGHRPRKNAMFRVFDLVKGNRFFLTVVSYSNGKANVEMSPEKPMTKSQKEKYV